MASEPMTTPEPSPLFSLEQIRAKAIEVDGFMPFDRHEPNASPVLIEACMFVDLKEMLDAFADLLEARAARPSPWQPMETAPKDTSILVSDGVDVWETHLGNLPYTSATTWQPLPAPPAQDGGTK